MKSRKPANLNVMMTLQEFAEFMKWRPRDVSQAARSGKIPYMGEGRRIRFHLLTVLITQENLSTPVLKRLKNGAI